MDHVLLAGIWGGLVAVLGAAYPEEKVSHPLYSTKNWLLAIGGLLLLVYSCLNYAFVSGSFFFILLESLVVMASLMMMANVKESLASIVLILAGVAFIAWSFFLYEDHQTIFFIVGLTGVALGYTFKMGSVKRSLALTLGSALIALFSFLGKDAVFFWLNAFFAVFSAYYLITAIRKR